VKLDSRSESAEELVRLFAPGFEVKRKSDSALWRLLMRFSKDRTLTTLWRTAEIPDDAPNTVRPLLWQDILHEGRHAVDHRGLGGVLSLLGYALPQLLVLPLLVAGSVLPWLLQPAWALLAVLGAALVAAPAPFRLRQELRAYEVTLAVEFWHTGGVAYKSLAAIVDSLAGPRYLFCWPFRDWLQCRLDGWVSDLRTNRARLDGYLLTCRELAMRYRGEDF
jgi:hypothetical protein